MCPVHFVCLSLAQDSNVEVLLLLLLFLALSRYFVGGYLGIWLLEGWFLILSFLVYVGFILSSVLM